MQFERKQYLEKLIKKRDNGRIKIITGLRRCGKSYLLFNLYRNFLLRSGIKEEQIIGIALDDIENAKYRNPFELNKYIRDRIYDKSKRFYVFIDEIQFVKEILNPYLNNSDAKLTFIDVILGLMKLPNADIYVTGSNSNMLSSDILTQFRDRGDEIRVYPLSYAEVFEQYKGDTRLLWREYLTYGGMPLVWTMDSHEERSTYLKDLFNLTYIKDVIERHKILNDAEVLDTLLNILASGIGSLTNPLRLSNTFESERHTRISPETISMYIGYFIDSFLIQSAVRYDVKGKKYIKTPLKYYFSDSGLRNAKLGFRQLEETHLMENILYTDLIRRGFNVDVGIVEQNIKDESGKKIKKQLEVDYVVNRGEKRCYIQSALSIEDPEKKKQEIASLIRIPDSFKKIVVVKDYMTPWQDDNGIYYIGVEQFLLDESII